MTDKIKSVTLLGDTGNSVIPIQYEGQFQACADKVNVCGYACCKFTLGNFIYVLEGEREAAALANLSEDHLSLEASKDGVEIGRASCRERV